MALQANGRRQPDEASDMVQRTVESFQRLQSDNKRLEQLLEDASKANALKDGELSAIGKALEHERSMRTFYQTFAVQVSMRLNTIMDEACTAMRDAQDAANREAEKGRGGELPIEVPSFMRRWQEEEAQRLATA